MKQTKKWIAGLLSLPILLSQGAIQGLEGTALTEAVYTNEAHISLAREAAEEGMVLLENNGALPIPAQQTVALFGCGQIHFQKGGGGSGDVNTLYVRSLLEGMQIKEAENKVKLYAPLVEAYTAYCEEHEQGEMPLEAADVGQAARKAQTAVVTISRYSIEGWDRPLDKSDFLLTRDERDILQKVKEAGFRKTVVVLNIGGVIDTSWFREYEVDAVLLAGQGGMEGGLAAADILVGDVNPSGKLADTFAKAYEDYPSSATFHESEHRDYLNYTDDIFVGYRYFETVPGAKEKVCYPFGYGLSYTDFTLSEPQVTEADGRLTARVEVKNTGERAGKEVVQLYFSAPQRDDRQVFLDKAAMELAAFQKTRLLEPGESETLTLSVELSEMASYDDVGKTGKKSAYVLEPGDYNLYLGNSVRNARERGACHTYRQAALEVTGQLTETLVPYRLEKRMTADGSYEELPYALTHPVKAAESNRIEAEDYTWGSQSIRVEKYETGEGGRCVAGLSGNSVTFQLDVEAAGDYRVYLRAANGYGDIQDALQISVNDAPQDGVRVDMPQTGDAQWYNFIDLTPFTVRLPAGEAVLKLTAPGNCGNLDSLVIEKAVENEHIVAALGQTKIEAEAFAELDERARVEDFSTDAETGACLADMGAEGTGVTYRLKTMEAGVYQLTLRAANGWDDITDMLRVYVDGVRQEEVCVNLPRTSVEGNPWHNYVELESFAITLPAGAAVLRLETGANGCGNLDSFTLEKVDNAAVPVGPDGPVTIEAEDYFRLDARGGTENFSTVDGSGVCVCNLSAEGTYVSYKLRVQEAGDYQVTLRASNGWGEIRNMMRVYVGDAEQSGVSITMPSTGTSDNQWHHFVDLEPFTVTLPAGTVILKLVSNGTCGNLDSLTIRKSGAGPAAHSQMRTAAETREAGMAAQADERLMLLDVYNDPARMGDFLAQLSLEELAGLCGGQPAFIRWQTGGFGNLTRYGIPNAQMLDGPAGIHTYELTTAWPTATLLAYTWNPALLERIGLAAAEEALLAGADIWLAPALNIHRNILCGRNFEYYSEDPLISGKMAAAITRGTQSGGVGVAIKHFAANNQETNRNDVDSRISERALREIYLKGFQICVQESDPWTVMSSYNFLNGQETSERYDLLTTILREEWGFDGLVMTDWGNNSFSWREIKAGNNLKMPWDNAQHLITACQKGLLTREELEENCAVILRLILKTNTFQTRVLTPVYQPISRYNTTRLQAADFAWLSSGIRPEACDDPESFQNLGALNQGEWMSYNLEVAQTGVYQTAFRIASNDGGGAFDIYLDDEKVGVFQNTVHTGGWQKWTTTQPLELELPAGKHTLKLAVTQSGMNLQWMSFTSPETGYTVGGRIEAGDTGLTDLAGIRVEIYDGTDTGFTQSLGQAVSDGQGGFRFDQPLGSGSYVLMIADEKGAYQAAQSFTLDGADCTGLTLTLQAAAAIVPGDMDGDGEVTIQDVMEACKVLARQSAGKAPTEDEMLRGNLDGDDKFTITDVMEICKILARKA